MRVFEFERRWSHLFAQALFADEAVGTTHDKRFLELLAFLDAGSAAARWAFRAGLVLFALAPFWRMRCLTPLNSLSLERRARLVSDLLNHPWYPVRELAFMLKVSMSLLLLGDDAIRATTNYDNPVWESEPLLQSGQRRRLAVVTPNIAKEVEDKNHEQKDTEVA